jgi:dihydroorotate dehydrogenase
MNLYAFLKPILFMLPPELAHTCGLLSARLIGLLYRHGFWGENSTEADDDVQTPFGLVKNRIGLAAGFDKNAEALWGWQALGFGFVEVGTITPLAQSGNPKPRLFRLPLRRALINKLGFNNKGAERIALNIRQARKQSTLKNKLTIKIGGNIGKNKDTPIDRAADDYKKAAKTICEFVDYLVINVSSPNTQGLRDLQSEAMLTEIVESVQSVAQSKPLFIKVAPDGFENYIEGLLNIVKKYNLSGVICGNTLVNHPYVSDSPQGGISGQPIFETNLKLVRAYSKANPQLFIIGVGGIETPSQFKQYLSGGASLCQAYTGFAYNGPSFIKMVLK